MPFAKMQLRSSTSGSLTGAAAGSGLLPTAPKKPPRGAGATWKGCTGQQMEAQQCLEVSLLLNLQKFSFHAVRAAREISSPPLRRAQGLVPALCLGADLKIGREGNLSIIADFCIQDVFVIVAGFLTLETGDGWRATPEFKDMLEAHSGYCYCPNPAELMQTLLLGA